MRIAKLKARMVERGFNNITLAKTINISVNALSRKINGVSQFKAREIEAISCCLSLDSPNEIVEIFLPVASHMCNDNRKEEEHWAPQTGTTSST